MFTALLCADSLPSPMQPAISLMIKQHIQPHNTTQQILTAFHRGYVICSDSSLPQWPYKPLTTAMKTAWAVTANSSIMKSTNNCTCSYSKIPGKTTPTTESALAQNSRENGTYDCICSYSKISLNEIPVKSAPTTTLQLQCKFFNNESSQQSYHQQHLRQILPHWNLPPNKGICSYTHKLSQDEICQQVNNKQTNKKTVPAGTEQIFAQWNLQTNTTTSAVTPIKFFNSDICK